MKIRYFRNATKERILLILPSTINLSFNFLPTQEAILVGNNHILHQSVFLCFFRPVQSNKNQNYPRNSYDRSRPVSFRQESIIKIFLYGRHR